jgi:hypothetical protein
LLGSRHGRLGKTELAVLPFLLFGVSGAAIIAAIVVTRRVAQERAQKLRELAARLGWTYLEEVDFGAVPDLDRFELFTSGRSKRLSNLLTSPAGERRAILFDYKYVTGSGKSSHTHRQTVFYATSEELDLPAFSLRPENFLHRFAQLFGYQDLDFAERPEFSRLFLLRGENEARVRDAFSEGVLRFFEDRPGNCAAAIGGELLLWKPGKYATPEEAEALIQQGDALALRFLGRGEA